MNGKFIYVFDDETRDTLIAKNYRLINSKNGMYIFENKVDMSFAMNDIHCVYSDTLTF